MRTIGTLSPTGCCKPSFMGVLTSWKLELLTFAAKLLLVSLLVMTSLSVFLRPLKPAELFWFDYCTDLSIAAASNPRPDEID